MDQPTVPASQPSKPNLASPTPVSSAATAPESRPIEAGHKPVMDVRQPQQAAAKPAEEAPATTPTDEVPAPAPPEEGKAKDKKTEAPATKSVKAAKPPKTPRQPGVGMAIAATVIIVLGLGLLATYAYLRTNNITLF